MHPRKITTFLVLLISLFLSACGAEQTSSNRSTLTPTNKLSIPTLTSTSTLTPVSTTVTAIPITSLSQPAYTQETISGKLSLPPYLVYSKKINGKEQVILVNQDGTGLKVIPLPNNGFNAGNVSPTGEWLVFYTGSGGFQTVLDGPQFDLALNLMHLPDGNTYKITDLLSADFPNNLEKVAEMAQENNPDIGTVPVDSLAPEIRYTMSYSLLISSWSPSGEALAFSGEMDGPSSDLYIYNLQTQEIRRLSSGSRNIDFIDWFPDGSQIFYSSSYVPCTGDCSIYYVTNLDGSKSREIINFETFGGDTIIDGWANNSSIIMHTDANGPGTCCLRNFDLENENLNMLYSDSFQSFSYDPQTSILAISIADSFTNIQPGTYLIDSTGMKKADKEVNLLYYLGWTDYPFIISGNDTKLLSSNGETKTLVAQAQSFVPFASRNNQYVALGDLEWGQTTNGLKVFNREGNLVLEINNQKVTKIIWRLDSLGLFYITNDQLFYVGIQDKLPILIDSHLTDENFDLPDMEFNWVR